MTKKQQNPATTMSDDGATPSKGKNIMTDQTLDFNFFYSYSSDLTGFRDLVNKHMEAFGRLEYGECIELLREKGGMTIPEALDVTKAAAEAAAAPPPEAKLPKGAIILKMRADNLVADAFVESMTVNGFKPMTQEKLGIDVLNPSTNLWEFIPKDKLHVLVKDFGGRCYYPKPKGGYQQVQMTNAMCQGTVNLVLKSNPSNPEPLRAFVESDGTITGVDKGAYFHRKARPEEHVRAEWAKGSYGLRNFQTLDDVREGCPESIKTLLMQYNEDADCLEPLPDLTLTQLLEASATAIFQLQWYVSKTLSDGCVYFITDDNDETAGGGRGKSVWAHLIKGMSAVTGVTPLTQFDDEKACYGLYKDNQGRLVTLNIEVDGDTKQALFDQGNLKKAPICEEIFVKSLYHNRQPIIPMCAHIMVTNKLPSILGGEDTTFDRITIISMGGDDIRKSEKHRVRDLLNRVDEPEAQAWFWNAAHWGMMNILKNGRITRDLVAMKRYKGSSDNVAEFITASLIPTPENRPVYLASEFNKVWEAYKQSSVEAGHRNHASRKDFKSALKEKGLLKSYTNGKLYVMADLRDAATPCDTPKPRDEENARLMRELKEMQDHIQQLELDRLAATLEEPTPPPARKPNPGTNAKDVTIAQFSDRPKVSTNLKPAPKSYIPAEFGVTEATREEMKPQPARKATPRRRSPEPEAHNEPLRGEVISILEDIEGGSK